MTKRLIGTWLFCAILVYPASSRADDNQATLDAIQKRYNAVQTMRARFVQKAYIKSMDQNQISTGEVYIKKPGKMKWTYNAPDPQVLISNDQTLWLYLPEEKQVTKTSIHDIYTTNTPALFLSGKGKLAEAFKVVSATPDAQKTTVILTPREKAQGLDKLILFVDSKNYQIVGSRVYDKLGNQTEITFSDIEINLAVADEMFDFQVPKGVDVLDSSPKEP